MALPELEKRYTDAARTMPRGGLSDMAASVFAGDRQDALEISLNNYDDAAQAGTLAQQIRRALQEGRRAMMGYELAAEASGVQGFGPATIVKQREEEKKKKEDFARDWQRYIERQEIIQRLNRDLERLAELQRQIKETEKEMERIKQYLAQDDAGNIDWDFYAQTHLSEDRYYRTPRNPEKQKEALKDVLLTPDGVPVDSSNDLARYLSAEHKRDVQVKAYNTKAKGSEDFLKNSGHSDLVDDFKKAREEQEKTGEVQILSEDNMDTENMAELQTAFMDVSPQDDAQAGHDRSLSHAFKTAQTVTSAQPDIESEFLDDVKAPGLQPLSKPMV